MLVFYAGGPRPVESLHSSGLVIGNQGLLCAGRPTHPDLAGGGNAHDALSARRTAPAGLGAPIGKVSLHATDGYGYRKPFATTLHLLPHGFRVLSSLVGILLWVEV